MESQALGACSNASRLVASFATTNHQPQRLFGLLPLHGNVH